jgi:CheY-like chemotaxis protein
VRTRPVGPPDRIAVPAPRAGRRVTHHALRSFHHIRRSALNDHTPTPQPGDTRLLVVDDDALVRRVLVRQLEQLGYPVVAASTAAEALAALTATDDVALMITDLRLGAGADGRALAAEARARRPGLRIVFMSGRADDRATPADGSEPAVLGKPFALSELHEVLARALG